MILRLCSLVFILIGGIINEARAEVELQRAWSRSTLQKMHLGYRYFNRMPPLLTKTMVIQGNAVDGIKAFDRASGNEKWARSFENGVEGGADISEERIFFGANNGQFYCLDAGTGQTLWQYPVYSESTTRPLVAGSYVYHITGNNTVYAFDAKSGQTIWVKTRGLKGNMTVRGLTSPVLHNGVLFVGYSDGDFVALNAENGRVLWSKTLGDDKRFNDVDADARITERCVLVSSYANALYCLDKQSGALLWRHDVGGFNPVLVSEKEIYYPTLNNEIHVLDGDSGKLLKKILIKRGLATEIVQLNNFLIYGESDGALVVRDKNTLNEVDRFYPGRGLFARPTLDSESGEVYILSSDANIFRLDLRTKKQPDFPWSKM